jgi:DNA-3-methyladenine glycosylase
LARLSRAFYARDSADVARELLGKVLVRPLDRVLLRGRIVEVEAYRGQADPGSHAYRGPSQRNSVMFGDAGHLYVYMSYGVHFCVNAVTDRGGIAGAVLLRALEPISGIVEMEKRRGPRPVVDLCNGPGKLCQAFGITREQNGIDLDTGEIWIEDDGWVSVQIDNSRRIGLSAGADLPLRFYVTDSPYVSRARPPAPRR